VTSEPAASGAVPGRLDLKADCSRCFGLCCVVPAFTASADFAIDKPAGQPCPNLGADFGCSIHDRLRRSGFGGCAAYDCFGAGQKVAQDTFGGRDWRRAPEIAGPMFAAFDVMRQLHELLWYLREALGLHPEDPLRAELAAALDATERCANLGPWDLTSVDVDLHRSAANVLLLRTSEQVRSRSGRLGSDLRGVDLFGKDLSDSDLRRGNLRGTMLVGARLRRADLSMADLTGADLRGADLGGTTLDTAIFLTQAQIDSARGDASTNLPASLSRPSHWPAGPVG
jgi:hypothetical protein